MSHKGGASEDMVQIGYETQWGPKGRDDLGMMSQLGANSVRLYHSLGVEADHDHGAFLDRAWALGLHAQIATHTYMPCPNDDCYDSWKKAVKAGFGNGFKKDGGWHPGVHMVILLNEPPGSAPSRVRRALSALEGLLDAEKDAGIEPGRVKLTVTWNFAESTSIDGKVTGPGVYGFQDMVAATANPSLAGYTPRTSVLELSDAFKNRWIHGLNVQAPWSFVKGQVQDHYAQFLPHQWFIGEYGAEWQTQATIESELQDMDKLAASNVGFAGVNMFQFQTAYAKGGSELHFGIFSLGNQKLGDVDVCSGNDCDTFPVYCLDTELTWFDRTPERNHRAEAVAKGWGGSVNGRGRCNAQQTRQDQLVI